MKKLVYVSDAEVEALVSVVGDIGEPAASAIKHIIYQADDSPIFCSAYNRPIKHLNPKAAVCQPFPLACKMCPRAMFDE